MKIAILGAAGVRTPLIVQAMALRQEQVGLTELALMDIDSERMELINTLITPMIGETPINFKITSTTDARQALTGADYVITTFRVGGIESRVIDERVPLELGVLGQETTGPGGFAMAMRTIPVLLRYIELMREVCPQAWLINFANPAGLLAELILRVAKWPRAVGICDAPGSMLRLSAALVGAPVDELYLDYFGLNHLGWVRSVIHQGKNHVPDFLALFQQIGEIPEIPFSPDLVNALQMIPNEYLYYYYYQRQSVDNILKLGQSRGEQITELNKELFDDLRRLRKEENFSEMVVRYHAYLDERGATYMQAETGQTHDLTQFDPALIEAVTSGGYAGVALELIEALAGRHPKTMVINVLNQGAISGMEAEDVVEVPAYVSKGFIRPLAVGQVPEHCLALMKQVKEYERLTIAAAVEGSYDKAVQALTIHPLVGDHLLARQILDTYRERHADFFPSLG